MLRLLLTTFAVSLLIQGIFETQAFSQDFSEELERARVIEDGYVRLKIQKDDHIIRLDRETLVGLIQGQNLDIAIAKARTKQAKGKLIESWAEFFPSITLTNSFEDLEGGQVIIREQPVIVDRQTFFPRLIVDYELQTGGRSFYRMKAAKNELKKSKLTQKRFLQNALRDSFIQYFTLIRDSEAVNVVQVAFKEADEQLNFMKIRHQFGFATRLDVVDAKAHKAEQHSQLLQAINTLEATQIKLGELLNLSPMIRLLPSEVDGQSVEYIDESESLDTLMVKAMAERPDLKELTHLIEASEAMYKARRSEFFPTVRLGGYYGGIGSKLGSLSKVTRFGTQFDIDLLRNMGVGTLGRMKKARGKTEELLVQKEKRLAGIKKNIAQTFYDTNFYRDQVAVAHEKVMAAEEAYRLAKVRAKGGVNIKVDLAKENTTFTEARLEYLTAMMDYNISQIKLLFETGQLVSNKLIEN